MADLGQRGGALLIRRVRQAAFQGAQHEGRRLAADADDERKAETGFVGGGIGLEAGELLAQAGHAQTALFGAG